MYVLKSEGHSVKRSLEAMSYETNRQIYRVFQVYEVGTRG